MNLPFSQLVIFFIVMTCSTLSAQKANKNQSQDYWSITDRNSILLDLTKEQRLPHKDNIEMSGRKVSTIVSYSIDAERKLSLNRDLIFPQLRTYLKSSDPDWKKYRAYFRRSIDDAALPSILIDNVILSPSHIDSVEISGFIKFYHTPAKGIRVVRTLFPSMTERLFIEKWELQNVTNEAKELSIENSQVILPELGYKGKYTMHVYSNAEGNITISAGETYTFATYYGATLNDENVSSFDFKKAEEERRGFLNTLKEQLVLETPDPVINTFFYFAKIRAAESIFDSSLGLIHSPGGGNYYVGIWANDQVEYSGPFFPYLGYDLANEAAYNAYAHFKKNIPKDDKAIPYAFEVDGNFVMDHLDRGDAAMIAYGTSHYLLARGDMKEAEELWPLIKWSLEWCHNHRNGQGAVTSQSDEMEGRIETGSANLSTSALYYGGLKYAQRLASALGMDDEANTYVVRKDGMAAVIESYFGAKIEGLNTYKYYAENKKLRHWICLPLNVGITTRKAGTLKALFSNMWTDNGVLVEYDPTSEKNQKVFWDRATLYALRGALKVGGTDIGMKRLTEFSRKRLLGDHVPYVVEAYPENNMRHLSAESALYCRIITEGLIGMEPISMDEMMITPSMPKTWDEIKLNNIALFGKKTDLTLTRKGKKIRVMLSRKGRNIANTRVDEGEGVVVKF